MTFHVNLTNSAKADVRAILRWLEERSPAGAEAWFRALAVALETIRERADSLAVAPESDDHAEPIRQIIFRTRRGRPYRALFSLRVTDVFVLHVRGPGQNLLSRRELQ